jgi:hypothetical protein
MSEINRYLKKQKKRDAINKVRGKFRYGTRYHKKILSMNQMKNKNRKTGTDDHKRITKLQKVTKAQ